MDIQTVRAALEGLVDELAAIEHERWSHWQRFLHSQCIAHGDDGSLLMPGHLAKRWAMQFSTPFHSLSEAEKNSDREQVQKYLPTIIRALERKSVP